MATVHCWVCSMCEDSVLKHYLKVNSTYGVLEAVTILKYFFVIFNVFRNFIVFYFEIQHI